jgi:hypothetical protein
MCLSFTTEERAQTCGRFLPEGWLYFFEDERENSDYYGLFLINHSNITSKRCFRYRSFQDAASRFQSSFENFDAGAFYEQVGLSRIGNARGSSLPPKKRAPRETATASYGCLTLQQLQERSCGGCENCSRQACGNCDSCAQAQGSQSSFENFDAFDNQVGLSKIGNARDSSLPPKKRAPRATALASYASLTLQQLQERSCGVCKNCSRQACGKCNSCAQAQGGCCLRRVRFIRNNVSTARFDFLSILLLLNRCVASLKWTKRPRRHHFSHLGGLSFSTHIR